MSQQFSGRLFITGLTTGVTNTRSIPIGSASLNKANAMLWTHGAFGLSVTHYSAGQSWTVGVMSNLAGVTLKIAEIGIIDGLSQCIIPLVNESTNGAGHVLGSTQAASIGILQPTALTFTGTSNGVGITFGCVVSACLYRI